MYDTTKGLLAPIYQAYKNQLCTRLGRGEFLSTAQRRELEWCTTVGWEELECFMVGREDVGWPRRSSRGSSVGRSILSWVY